MPKNLFYVNLKNITYDSYTDVNCWGLCLEDWSLITVLNNNKITSMAPISSENPSSVAQQNQRIKYSRVHVQCKKSLTDGWRYQEAKEDRQF